MIFLAVVAGVAALISGAVQGSMIIDHHRKGYRPPLWLRVALGVSAFASFYFAVGYMVIVADPATQPLVSAFYFRTAIPILFMGSTILAVYALRQAAQHETFVELQNQFVANVSHELRTPLAIIGGFAEMLDAQWEDVDETTRRIHLGYIHHQATNMNWLIRMLLDFYKSNEDVFTKGVFEPVDLSQLVVDTATAVRLAMAEPKGVTLTISQIDPVTVQGSPIRLELMLNNLLVNAVKFSPPGTTGGTVDVSLTKEGDAAVITVRDSGVGIDPAFMPHLFKPFRQADGSDRRQFGGVGLGLAVVKLIVEAHGGQISVHSRPGEGSVFRVHLPLGGTV